VSQSKSNPSQSKSRRDAEVKLEANLTEPRSALSRGHAGSLKPLQEERGSGEEAESGSRADGLGEGVDPESTREERGEVSVLSSFAKSREKKEDETDLMARPWSDGEEKKRKNSVELSTAEIEGGAEEDSQSNLRNEGASDSR